MTLDELKPGTVVVTRFGYRLAVIVRQDLNKPKYPVIYTMSADDKEYKGAVTDILAIVGTADLAAIKAAVPTLSAPIAPPVFPVLPAILPYPITGKKPGDTIRIKTRTGEKEAEFIGYIPSRYKFPVSVRFDGKEYKCPLFAIVPDNPAAQPAGLTDELKRKFMVLANHLSPENLCCDGELSQAQVNKRRAHLNSEWRALEAQAGKTVTEDEVWKWNLKPSAA